MKTLCAFVGPAALLIGSLASAQTPAQSQSEEGKTRLLLETLTQAQAELAQTRAAAAEAGPIEFQGSTFEFVSTQMSVGGKVVKGAPYSAQGVTETVQVLGDGNRISNKSTTTIYRDGEGRERREQTLNAIGPLASQEGSSQTIIITDPVAQATYTLNPQARTYRKMGAVSVAYTAKPGVAVAGSVASSASPRITISTATTAAVGDNVIYYRNNAQHSTKNEDLGTQMIEGVRAQGTRSTITIPAGEIGNERAIDIVSERWYSPDLQTVVMTKHNDPRTGETTYRLTNIVRAEPLHSLFEVPSDFTEAQLPGVNVMKKMKKQDN